MEYSSKHHGNMCKISQVGVFMQGWKQMIKGENKWVYSPLYSNCMCTAQYYNLSIYIYFFPTITFIQVNQYVIYVSFQ